MDPPRKSLESTSVKQLVQISEEEYPRESQVSLVLAAPTSLRKVPPLGKSLALRPRTQSPGFNLSSRSSQIKSAGPSPPPQLSTTRTQFCPVRTALEAFSPGQLTALAASGCKCVFVGGGGFRGTTQTVPCRSQLCINRVSWKSKWESESCLRQQKGGKTDSLQKLKSTGHPDIGAWFRPLSSSPRSTESVHQNALRPHFPVKRQSNPHKRVEKTPHTPQFVRLGRDNNPSLQTTISPDHKSSAGRAKSTRIK